MERPVLELSNNPAGKNIRLMWVIVFSAFVIGLGSAGLAWYSYQQDIAIFEGVEIKPEQYQAVFMEGGQVYFGKLEVSKKWLILKDVYYLQASGGSDGAQNFGSNFQLVKLGSEIHGPEDVMYIDPQNVIFWENIKSESQVVQAISKAKNSR